MTNISHIDNNLIITNPKINDSTIWYNNEAVVLACNTESIEDDIIVMIGYNVYINGQQAVEDIAERLFNEQ